MLVIINEEQELVVKTEFINKKMYFGNLTSTTLENFKITPICGKLGQSTSFTTRTESKLSSKFQPMSQEALPSSATQASQPYKI